jgi:hypothetical protein
MKRLGLLVVVLVTAGLLSACLPTTPPPAPPVTAYTKGFDACAAPSATTMSKWKTSSPYVGIGVYIGGANRGCAQPNLTSSWISTVWAQGWKLLPIWVGPQAPCFASTSTKIPTDPTMAFYTGLTQGGAAADAATNLNLGWLSPIYFDLEGYPRGGSCTAAVQSFVDGWVRALNARGFRAGMYSSLCSGILDVAATVSDPTKVPLNAIWIAAWNNSPNIYGFTACGAATAANTLSDTVWNDHQRVHQYVGGHNETYGGVTINIDNDAIDGPTG